MRRGVAVLLFLALPVLAGEQPPGCAWLCGSWTLDAALSERPEPVVDAALEKRADATRLREELLAALTGPTTFVLADNGDEILLRVPSRPERRLTANRSHARVDQYGTAEIRASWRNDDSLLVTESYDRRRNQSESYALQRDGTLVITREVERPGIKRLKVRAVYRRS